MQAYSRLFAKVYNLKWGDYANRIAPLIFEFYESTSTSKQHKTLLDLCCGTGQLLGYFLEKDYRVVGLDLSEAMVAITQEKLMPYVIARQANFVQGNAACFSFDENFGLVVSTYDALNHLPDMKSMEGCFRSTFDVLVGGGYFIFDLNTALGLRNWNSLNINPEEEVFLFNRGIFDDQIGKAWTKITGFVRNDDGLYERFDETVYNTPFKLRAVNEGLMKVGFRSVYFALGSDLTTPIDNPEDVGKVFIISKK